jgi:Protein of unknown function (DUF3309)
MSFKAPATCQKIKARCTGFYGGNSLRKAMPRRTKLCYGGGGLGLVLIIVLILVLLGRI